VEANRPKSADDKEDERDRIEREKRKDEDYKKRTGEARDNMTPSEKVRDEEREKEVERRERVEQDPHGTGNFIKKQPAFVVGVIAALVVFYIVAIYYAFMAYREFKGIAEDTAGGPENLNQGANIMAYGTIEPRDQRDRARDDIRNRQEQRRRRNNYDREN